MGKRGPQPQSAELKALRGNPGKRRLPNPPRAEALCPPCPTDLYHLEIGWNYYGNILARLGILRATDEMAYGALWRTFDKYIKAAEAGALALASGDPEQMIAAAKYGALELQYLGVLIKLLDRFGMNPSSRSSIGIEAPKGEEKSEFERLREKLAKKQA